VTLPADYTFIGGDNGIHTFSNGVILQTKGAQAVTATDTQSLSVTGTATINVDQPRGCLNPQTTYAVGTNPYSIAVADLNGDGKLDLAVADISDSTISIFLGKGDGTFPSPLSASGSAGRMTAALAGDFNEDGKLDLAIAYGNATGSVGIRLGNGDGTFQAEVPYASNTNSPIDAKLGDFNRDGHLDVAIVSSTSAVVSVFLGNGNGTLQPVMNFNTAAYPRAIAVADLNGDGKLDVVTASSNGFNNYISVLLGNGDGTLQTANTLPYAGNSPYSIAIADFNGDGKPDLAVANLGGNVSVLFGNGDGTFQPAINYAAGSGPRWVAVADLNGDGIPDLIVASLNDNALNVLFGTGDGTFQPAVQYSVGNSPTSVFVGDLNSDGKQDLVVANENSNTIGVLLNKGICPGPASHFQLSAPASTMAGSSFNFSATALDQFSTISTGYGGTVHFTSSDGAATLPADTPLSNGIGTFNATLRTAASQSLSAADSVTATINGSTNMTVNPGAASHFGISVPANTTAGAYLNAGVTALDAFNNTVTGYSGTIHFSSTDTGAFLPGNYTFTVGMGGDNGTHAFTNALVLETLGDQTFSVTDASLLTGTSGAIHVSQGSTQIAVAASRNPFFFRNQVVLTATVIVPGGKADLSGTVSFYDGATLLGARPLDGTGHASLDASNLGLGMHVITAGFASANSSFQNSNSPSLFLRRSPAPRAIP